MQYTRYSSSDVGGPGLLTGQAGTLITLLDAILVTGYGAYAPAGWSHPVATAGNIASYKNGAGSSQLGIVINDNGPNATSTTKEAWITGWENVLGVGAPVGTGTGQFPTPAQLLTTGHGVITKSTTADATGRAWVAWADAHTLLLGIATASTGVYSFYYIGDISPDKIGSSDAYRFLLIVKATENTANEIWGQIVASTAKAGHFMARTAGGGGTSITCGHHGDMGKSASNSLAGLVQTPNTPNNAYLISPIYIHENVGVIIRGRLRGMYHLCHPSTNFADGQTISGAGDYAGKEFYIVRDITDQLGGNMAVLVETSDTLETGI